MLKQVILIRKDLGMTQGKIAAQACHASLGAYRKSEKTHKKKTDEWLRQGAKKVVLWVEDEEELNELENDVPREVPKNRVKDAGLTELEPGTHTALGIGPWEEKEIDKFTGHLKAVK